MVSDIKDKILDAAVQLLVEQGAAALTQPKIAAAAGVRQSHLTYYFPKRNDLLLAITLHWGKLHMAAAAQRMEPGTVTLAQLTQFIGDRVVDAGRVRIILSLMVASEEDPRIKESLASFIETERQATGTMLSVVGLPHDERLRAVVHATLVGFAVLNLARGPGVEKESRELTAHWLQQALPLLAGQLQEDPGQADATTSSKHAAVKKKGVSKAQANNTTGGKRQGRSVSRRKTKNS